MAMVQFDSIIFFPDVFGVFGSSIRPTVFLLPLAVNIFISDKPIAVFIIKKKPLP